MSPHTVTGDSILCTLLSSTKISIAFEHRSFTSLSFRTSHRRSVAIIWSKSEVAIAVN